MKKFGTTSLIVQRSISCFRCFRQYVINRTGDQVSGRVLTLSQHPEMGLAASDLSAFLMRTSLGNRLLLVSTTNRDLRINKQSMYLHENFLTNFLNKLRSTKKPHKAASCNSLILLVGARGFEPPTPCTPCKYATRLRYAPTKAGL